MLIDQTQMVIPSSDNRYKQVEFLQNINPIIYDKSKRFWIWDTSNKYYEIGDNTTILKLFRDIIHDDNTHKSQDKAEILESVRQTGRVPIDIPSKNYIQFKNCVININDSQRFIADPDYFWTNPIPHNLGSCGDTPTIDKLFEDWVGKKHVISLYEILAYTLYRGFPIHKIFVLFGKGRNGKGQYSQIIEKFVGENNICSTSLDNLVNNKFEAARLYNKLVGIMGETDSNKLRKTSLLKSISGDDTIEAELKGHNGVNFKNYAVPIIGTNNLPPSDDDSDGFNDRWFIIDFPNQFKDTGIPIIDMIPDYEYENLGYKLIGILKDLLSRGKFTNQGSIQENRDKYNRTSRPLESFIDEKMIVVNPENIDGRIPVNIFWDAYNWWQIKNNLKLINKSQVTKQIRDLNKYEVKNGKVEKRTQLCIFGLNLDINHVDVTVDSGYYNDEQEPPEYNGF